jgi:hypothetical protein
VPYQVRVFAQENESVTQRQVYPADATPTDTAFATFKELLEHFPDVARGLLRGTLGPPTKRESGLHRYETDLTLDALERDFPNVAAAVTRRGAFGAAARESTWHLQMIESGESAALAGRHPDVQAIPAPGSEWRLESRATGSCGSGGGGTQPARAPRSSRQSPRVSSGGV